MTGTAKDPPAVATGTPRPAGVAPADRPLSAAAGQLLLRLGGPVGRSPRSATPFRLAVQELVLRGALLARLESRGPVRRPLVHVEPGPALPADAPGAVAYVDGLLRDAGAGELRAVVVEVAGSAVPLHAFCVDAALGELEARALVATRRERVLGLATEGRRRTAEGDARAADLRDRLRALDRDLPSLAAGDPAAAAALARAAGAACLLEPEALEVLATLPDPGGAAAVAPADLDVVSAARRLGREAGGTGPAGLLAAVRRRVERVAGDRPGYEDGTGGCGGCGGCGG